MPRILLPLIPRPLLPLMPRILLPLIPATVASDTAALAEFASQAKAKKPKQGATMAIRTPT
jgi:hypothetical protein